MATGQCLDLYKWPGPEARLADQMAAARADEFSRFTPHPAGGSATWIVYDQKWLRVRVVGLHVGRDAIDNLANDRAAEMARPAAVYLNRESQLTPWLREKLTNPATKDLKKLALRKLALDEMPQLSPTQFGKVWEKVVVDFPEKRKAGAPRKTIGSG